MGYQEEFLPLLVPKETKQTRISKMTVYESRSNVSSTCKLVAYGVNIVRSQDVAENFSGQKIQEIFMPVAVIVDWYGPYGSVEEFKYAIGSWGRGRFLYMGIGANNKIRYIGLTGAPGGRFYNHPKIHDPQNIKFFAGEICTQGLSGRRTKKTPADLAAAERLLISYFQPTLNQRLKYSDIDDCVSVFSRFFDKIDHDKPLNPLKKFPPIIAYNCYTEEYFS